MLLRILGKNLKAMPRAFPFTFQKRNFAETVKIRYVVQGTKQEYVINAPLGGNLWEEAQKNGVPLEGACEGNCACGTCHVIVQQEIFKKLPPAKDEEEDLLQVAFGRQANSRLSCQVKITKDFDGTTVIIPSQSRNIDVNKL